METMLDLAARKRELTVVDDQTGTPTFVSDLCAEMERVIETEAYGIYHISNQGACSWFEYACQLFELADIDIEVRPITTTALGRAAPRPTYSVLRNYVLELTIGDRMRPWEEALKDYLVIRGENLL